MNAEELSCTNCGAPLQESAISPHMKVAKCTHCNSIFSLEARAVPDEQDEPPLPPLPKHFHVVELDDKLAISWEWFDGGYVLHLFFGIIAVLLAGFLLRVSKDALIIVDLFSLVLLAVGVGLVYFAFAGFLNTTTLSVTNKLLSVNHEPMPWISPPDLHSGNIKQLYCIQKITKGEEGSSISYELHAALIDDRHIKLLSLGSYEQVFALERKIEKFLKIRDRPVRGEVGAL
jgi:hypothetical protein